MTAPTIKVYRFRKWDTAADEYVTSTRMGTRDAIAKIQAELIPGTDADVLQIHVDETGLTSKHFFPPEDIKR